MKRFKALPIALIVFLWSSFALAGRLVVHDEARLLSPSDVSGLEAKAAGWPFETHLLTAVSPAKESLEARAKAWVDAPKVVVIALDPQNHWTVVRVGTGTNVKTGDFAAIAQAGNPSFREAHWKTGIEAIGERAATSVRTEAGTVVPAAPIVVREGLSPVAWGFIIFGAIAAVWIAVYLYRRSKRQTEMFETALNENREETAALRSDNIRNDRWADSSTTTPAPSRVRPTVYSSGNPFATSRSYAAPTPAVVPAPSTVVVNQGGGSSDLLTGMAIGHMMNDHGHSHTHHDTVVHERVVEHEPVRRSYDAGGSSSNYDSGGSSSSYESSSSYDSGGSSSSWSSSSDSSSSSSSWDSGSSSSYDSGGSSSSFDSGGSSSDW